MDDFISSKVIVNLGFFEEILLGSYQLIVDYFSMSAFGIEQGV